MQTDLQLLLLIVGMMVSLLVIFKALRERHSRRSKPSKSLPTRSSFQKKIIQNTHKAPAFQKKQHFKDPLLEGYSEAERTRTPKLKTAVEPSSPVVKPLPIMKQKSAPLRPEEIIMVALLPRHASEFLGRELLGAFEKLGYYHGKMKIFHRHESNDPQQPVLYSIASLVEPGIFNLETMPYDAYHGIILWSVLRAGIDQTVFEKMLVDAKQLAQLLNATLCDETFQQLTVQAITDRRSRVQEYLGCGPESKKTN